MGNVFMKVSVKPHISQEGDYYCIDRKLYSYLKLLVGLFVVSVALNVILFINLFAFKDTDRRLMFYKDAIEGVKDRIPEVIVRPRDNNEQDDDVGEVNGEKMLL
jgi:hypothetical protein